MSRKKRVRTLEDVRDALQAVGKMYMDVERQHAAEDTNEEAARLMEGCATTLLAAVDACQRLIAVRRQANAALELAGLALQMGGPGEAWQAAERVLQNQTEMYRTFLYSLCRLSEAIGNARSTCLFSIENDSRVLVLRAASRAIGRAYIVLSKPILF